MSVLVVTLTVVVFITISLVFQLLPIISVPVTSHLTLSRFYNSSYGVFGWCYEQSGSLGRICTDPQIGYGDLQVSTSRQKTFLPSKLKSSVTKLLVVHPLSLAVTFILWVMALLILFSKLGSSPKYLLLVAMFSLPTFLFCLLCFLVDILIFISHLAWPGWLMLANTVLIAICCFLLWTLRRSVSIKNYEALHSEDRASSIETYSMTNVKLADSKSRTTEHPSLLDGDTNSLSEPELTYRGNII